MEIEWKTLYGNNLLGKYRQMDKGQWQLTTLDILTAAPLDLWLDLESLKDVKEIFSEEDKLKSNNISYTLNRYN